MRSTALFLVTSVFLLAACDPFGSDPGDSGTDCFSDGCDISGHVTTEAGRPLEGVRVDISGGEWGYAVTDENGYYALTKILMMRDYCVTPSKGPWEFEPEKHCFKDLTRNHTGQDFIAARIDSFDIAGTVIDSRSIPVSNVVLLLTGAAEKNVRTNTAGFYAFRSLRGREDYCISPYKEGYTFEPAERCYTYLDSTFDRENYLATLDE